MMRDYDPRTGRYIEADAHGLNGGLSMYGYAGQNPIMAYDPTGEYFWFLLMGGAAGGITASEAFIWSLIGLSLVYATAHDLSSGSIDRDIWYPEKTAGKWSCKARADCNDNIPGNCPDNPKHKFAFGGGIANDQGTARNIAKSNATSNLQCQPKHVSCKCTGPKGEQYSGGC